MLMLILFTIRDFDSYYRFNQKTRICFIILKRLEGEKFRDSTPASSMTKDIDQYV